MKKSRLVGLPSGVVGLLMLTLSFQLQAQLCFDIFEDLPGPSKSCSDTLYFVDGADGAPGSTFFGKADAGLLNSDFDGSDLFDPLIGGLEPPENLIHPFFSESKVTFQIDSDGFLTSFGTEQRGQAIAGARHSRFQEFGFGSGGHMAFEAFFADPGDIDPGIDTVPLVIDFDFHAGLGDPSENATRGGARAGAGVRVFGEDPMETLLDFAGISELDLANNDVPIFFGDFDGPEAGFEPAGPDIDDVFGIDVEFLREVVAQRDERLILDTESFGSIFTDGFESGDTAAWSATSADTFKLGVSSSNPDLRFRVIATPLVPDSLSMVNRLVSFDNDNKDDVLLRNLVSGEWLIDFMNFRAIRPNSGPADIFRNTEWALMGHGDFNGSGRGDVLLRHKHLAEWAIVMMNGRNGKSGLSKMTTDRDWVVAAVDDLDGDGKDDVLLRNIVTGRWRVNFMNFWFVRPDSGATAIFANLDWQMMGTGDFSGNGRAGVLLRNSKSGAWWIFEMNGRNNTSGKTLLPKNQDFVIAGIDDFDGDGKDDVLLRNTVTGRWRIYFMNSRTVRPNSGSAQIFANLAWEIVATGEFNDSGRAGVVLRNKNTGRWWIFMMNGRNSNSGGTAITADQEWMPPYAVD